MTARKTKTAAKPVVVEDVAPKTPVNEAIDESFEARYQRYAAALDDMTRDLSGWKRQLVAFVSMVFVGWGVAAIAMSVLDMLVLAAAALTGSAFLALIIWVLGFAATFFASIKIGSLAYEAVMSGHIERSITQAINVARSRLNFRRTQHA